MASEQKIPQKFELTPAVVEHKERISRLLMKSFSKDEPLQSSLRDLPTDQRESKILDRLEEGHSFVIVNTLDKSQDNIVALALNYEAASSDLQELENHLLTKKDRSRRNELLLNFFVKFERDADVWNKIKIRRALQLFILSVSADYRGLGLASELIKKTVEHARSQNFSHVLVVTTSYYSEKAVEKIGFQCVHQVRIDEHFDEKGEVAFKTEKPHEFVKYYAIEL